MGGTVLAQPSPPEHSAPARAAKAATALMGVQLASAALQVVQQYSAGEITQDQAHAMLVAAASNLNSAIDQFNAAGQPKPTAG